MFLEFQCVFLRALQLLSFSPGDCLASSLSYNDSENPELEFLVRLRLMDFHLSFISGVRRKIGTEYPMTHSQSVICKRFSTHATIFYFERFNERQNESVTLVVKRVALFCIVRQE